MSFRLVNLVFLGTIIAALKVESHLLLSVEAVSWTTVDQGHCGLCSLSGGLSGNLFILGPILDKCLIKFNVSNSS